MLKKTLVVCPGPRLRGVFGALVAASLLNASFAQSDPGESAGLLEGGAIEEYTLYPITRADEDGSRRPRFVFLSGSEYQFSSSIDRAGDFSVFRAHSGLGVTVPVADQVNIAFGGSFGYARYDFDRAAVFGGERPWEHIFTAQVSAIADYVLNDTWLLFGGGIFGVSGEDGAGFGDSVVGGGLLGAGYRHSEQLSFRFGASVMSQIEDDAILLPVLLVDWRIDERWRMRLGSLDTAAGDLVGGGLSYAITERLSVGGRLSWTRARFRLDDSGFAPGGVGQDDRFKGTLAVNWRATDSIDLGLHGGVVFGGKLRIEDENGDRLFREDYDPAALIGARLTWRF